MLIPSSGWLKVGGGDLKELFFFLQKHDFFSKP
jgi:hypothetical protein